MKSRILALEEIALEDKRFDLGFARTYESLRRSIAQVGILQPLIVRRVAPGERFQIVCGFGRALAAAGLGMEDLPVRAVAERTSDGDCLRLALFDNLGHREFNPIEQAIALEKLSGHVERDRLVRHYMPLLGLQPSEALLERVLSLRRLVESLQLAVARGRIEPGVAARLARFAPEDQEAFGRLLEKCRATVSVARELAETLADLARRDTCSIAEVLSRDQIAAIVDSPEMTAAERTAALRHRLRLLRFPTLADCEARFEAARKSLRLPPSMQLEHAPAFESDDLRLVIRFRTEGELRAAARTMAHWFDEPSLLSDLWPTRTPARGDK